MKNCYNLCLFELYNSIIIYLSTLMNLIVISLLVCLSFSAFDITDYGAVPHSDTVSAQFRNQKAILEAFRAANASAVDRVVRIPAKTYYSMPIRIENASNVSILILGKLSASKNVRYWPKQP